MRAAVSQVSRFLRRKPPRRVGAAGEAGESLAIRGSVPAAREKAAREGIQGASWSQLGTTIPVVLHAVPEALSPGDDVMHAGICSLLHSFAHLTWKVGR